MSIKNKIVNPDPQEERDKIAFNESEMTEFLFGKDRLEVLARVVSDQKKYPEIKTGFEWYEMTREEKMEDWLKKYNRMAAIDRDFYIDNPVNSRMFSWTYLQVGINPLGMHTSMFTKCIEDLASDEQGSALLPKVKSLGMIGCYAQTELGHGSNVSGLETTAKLDTKTDEFIIHSPTITSTKFWPGSLGVMANHAVVFAKLYTGLDEDFDYGPQAFLVPIRSVETHMPLEGIEVGDLGAKFGYNSMDNGYLRFNQVRIPRTNLLCRFAGVTADGEFEMRGDPRLLYRIMVNTRMLLIFGSGFFMYKALTIATRYAVCRRQFKTVPGVKSERKLLDY